MARPGHRSGQLAAATPNCRWNIIYRLHLKQTGQNADHRKVAPRARNSLTCFKRILRNEAQTTPSAAKGNQ